MQKIKLVVFFLLIIIINSQTVLAQSETLSSGSFIVNMGVTPQTIANGLKPYGLVYDLVRNYSVPVRWVISSGKVKDGVDFTYNGTQYKGGTFIIPVEYRTPAVNSRITYWTGQGVVGENTTSSLNVNITYVIKSFPRWTLDATNGSIAQGYLTNAGINLTAFPNAYNWKSPQSLDCCDDFFVMPHADPTWATHGNLYNWNKNCLGSIWAACHAVSALENSINPSNTAEQMNFLSTRSAAVSPTPWPNNSLTLFSSHSGGSIPYTHQFFDDPIAQYMGVTDLAQLNGSEQMYLPKQDASPNNTRWRPGAKIIAYDPTQSNVLNPDLANGNVGAVLVYGRGFDDPNRGYVMYEAGHSHNKGTAGDVAAQRAFLNFSFFQILPKAPNITTTGITTGQNINSGANVPVSASATSPLAGITFSYLWTSSCGGSFANSTLANTTFTAPAVTSITPCTITCQVSDNCGRTSFLSYAVTILPPPASPVANNDVGNISGSCTPGTNVTINVLRNDNDPQGLALTLFSLNQASATSGAGTWSITGDSSVTFTPNPNFNGTASIQYQIKNISGSSANATVSVSVGTLDGNGCTSNQVYAPQEIGLIDLSNFVSQNATGASLGGTALDDIEDTYNTAGTDYLNFGTSSNDSLVLSTGSTQPLRAKDSINIYWSKGANGIGTISVLIGQSATGPWTNAQTFTNSVSGTGSAVSTMSIYTVPAGVNGITHIKITAGTTSPLANSAVAVWLDAVEYEYLSCVSREPVLENDEATVLEDAPASLDVLNNDNDPQGSSLTIKEITVAPTKGKVSINTDGTITYNSNYDVNGVDSFFYKACNADGYCSEAMVKVSINADGCSAGSYKPNPAGGAVTKIFQYGFNGTNKATANATSSNFNDSWLDQSSGNINNNYGTSKTLDVGKTTNQRRSIFYFNVSEIPNNAIVQSAIFSAYRENGDRGANLTISAYPLTNSWVENQVSWNNKSTGNAWTTPGGDYGSLLATTAVPATKAFYNWNIGASGVQSWLTNSANNRGILLRQNITTLDKRHQFTSKENTKTPLFRPKLSITYILPEPCTAIPNRAPLANPNVATVMNGQSVVISPLSNDGDVDAGNTLTINGVSSISGGSATFTNSTVTYTANISAIVPRTERLIYRISDGNGGLDSAYIYITVTNAPSTANRDNASTNSSVMVSIPVTSNDSDPEGGAITNPTITIRPRNGSAVVSGNNINYTPAVGFTGKDTLIYSICETVSGSCSPDPLCDTALVVITVSNQTPVANNNIRTVLPCLSNTIDLISNDTDPENGTLTVSNISALSNPAAGSLVNNQDGTVTFTPVAGYSGTVTFTYTVTDNGVTSLTSSPATVSITVSSPVNSAPIANDDQETFYMDQTDYFAVVDNDTDPDNNTLTNPIITVQPLHGTATVLANGLIKYIPNRGYYGKDTLSYQICDLVNNALNCSASQEKCDTAKLSYNILPLNTVTAINDENSTWVNTPVGGSILNNDFDSEGDSPIQFNGFIIGGISYTSGTITVSGVNASGNAVLNAGTIIINANGTYTYTPANNFIGYIDIPYSIRDNNSNAAYDTAFLHITVNPLPNVSNSVIANNDEYNTPINVNVNGNILTSNDFDPQRDVFNLTSFTIDSDGNGTQDGTGSIGSVITIGGITSTGLPVSNAGTLILNSNGSFTFNPQDDFTGSVNVVYTITDANSAISRAILQIDIVPDANGPLNDPPVAGDDFTYTNINTPVRGSFASNDSDPNSNPISYGGTTINPAGPALPIGTPVTTEQGGTIQFFSNGTYLYTPPSNYSGPDKVNYQICDVTLVSPQPLCGNAIIHLLVGPANTTNAINDENSTWQDVNISGNVLTNDYDAEVNTQTFGSFLNQANNASITSGAIVSGLSATGSPFANAGTLTFDASGNYSFDPDPAFIGTISIPYTVCDNGVTPKCDTAYLTITVSPLPYIENSVIANNDENISYGNPVSNNLLLNDADPQGNNFTITAVTGGTVGTGFPVAGVDQNGIPVVNAGTLIVNANGSYTFTPASGFVGSINVPYTITDNNASPSTSTAILHIDVLADQNGPLNDPPFAGDDFINTPINTPVNGNFIGNDSDPNGNSISLNGTTIVPSGPQTPIGTPVTTQQGGTIQFYADGTYTYTPPSGYTGPDFCNYTICDVTVVNPNPLCNQAMIHFLVAPVPPVPVTLTTFNAVLISKKQSKLFWISQSEINLHHYEIERSTDGLKFISRGFINAKGSLTSSQNYSFIDELNTNAAIVFYRLKIVDNDGKFKYSNVVSLKLNNSSTVDQIKVYPNPFVSNINIELISLHEETAAIRILNANGKTVYKEQTQLKTGGNLITIPNLEKYSKSTYLIEIKTNSNRVVRKVIKNQ